MNTIEIVCFIICKKDTKCRLANKGNFLYLQACTLEMERELLAGPRQQSAMVPECAVKLGCWIFFGVCNVFKLPSGFGWLYQRLGWLFRDGFAFRTPQ